MNINRLDQQVSVSGQLSSEDIASLTALGIELLVCNRPDNESDDQPSYKAIEAAAQANGIEIYNIPFSGGQMQAEQVDAFIALLNTQKRIHAYCRTGNRSSQLWAAAKQMA
jgi:uncharacterized protein (TIGR01244 family)